MPRRCINPGGYGTEQPYRRRTERRPRLMDRIRFDRRTNHLVTRLTDAIEGLTEELERHNDLREQTDAESSDE